MDNEQDDIVKYKQGKLSPSEKHALEKKALSDPFLADALVGIEGLTTQSLDNDLKELDHRFTSTPSKMKIWILRIAASLLILLGGWWLALELTDQTKKPELTLQSEEQYLPPTSDTLESNSTSIPKSEETSEVDRSNKSVSPINVETKKEPVLDISKEEKLTSAKGASTLSIKPDVATPEPIATSESAEQQVAKEEAVKDVASQSARMKKSSIANENSEIITGRVTSAEDGSPIPGVNVVVKGTPVGTITDLEGNFKIAAAQQQPQLVMSFVGFQSKEVVATLSPLNVTLNSDATQLSEVVVTGYGAAPDAADREPVIKLAEPVGGRKAYDNYLKKSLQYPQQAIDNKVKGRVTVQFTVKTNGTLDEFSILKGLGYGCDEEVIRLVKEGPRWSPTTEDSVPVESEVRVRVRFSLPD